MQNLNIFNNPLLKCYCICYVQTLQFIIVCVQQCIFKAIIKAKQSNSSDYIKSKIFFNFISHFLQTIEKEFNNVFFENHCSICMLHCWSKYFNLNKYPKAISKVS